MAMCAVCLRWLSLTHLSRWQGEEKLSIEPSWSPKGGIDCIDPIGRSDDHNLPTAVQPVHESEEGGDDGRVDLVLPAGTDWGQTVDLVKEDNGGAHLVGLG